MRSSVEGMSPAKIAIAEAVTIAPTAGIGSMKKVSGTSSAIAIVAVSPGIAPTTRPKQADRTIVVRTSTRKTSSKAWAIGLISINPSGSGRGGPRAVEPAGGCRRGIA